MMAGLGSLRLVDSPDFRNATNGFTGVKVEAEVADLQAEALRALPQQRRPDEPDAIEANRPALDREGFDQQVWGIDLRVGRALGPLDPGITYVGFHEDDRPGRPTRNRQLHSLGARLVADPARGRFDLDTEAYVQLGTIRAGLAPEAPRQRVEAGSARIEAGYSFDGSWQPRLSLRYDWASGDRPRGHLRPLRPAVRQPRSGFRSFRPLCRHRPRQHQLAGPSPWPRTRPERRPCDGPPALGPTARPTASRPAACAIPRADPAASRARGWKAASVTG